MGFFDRLLKQPVTPPTPKHAPPAERVLGLWNLQGPASDAWRNTDREALSPLFDRTQELDSHCPQCDVLLLYCTIQSGGRIDGVSSSLSDIARGARARIMIVASENQGANFTGGLIGPLEGVNLVMTIDRHGDHFPRFFQRLFTMMKQGTPMPVAWEKLAPQVPGLEHAEGPAAIFACGAGGLRW